MELPVITTSVGGIPELVSEGVTGFLVPPDNEEMLASRLRVLVADSELRIRMGQQARKLVEQRFNLFTCAESIVHFLKEAADRGVPGRRHPESLQPSVLQVSATPR